MNWPERVWIYSPVRVFFQKREVRKWLGVAPPPQGCIALEIGCGLGRGVELIVDMLKAKEVYAFDLEHKLVKWAHRRLPSKYHQSSAFYTGDAQELPFRDSTFDILVNFGIIHHVLDWRKCIYEIGRVLKPGGYFYFEEIYPPLYANPLFKMMLQHPVEDRFYEKDFIDCLAANGMHLMPGVKTGSKFGLVGVARKK